jgi:hypothetical protein
MIKLKANTYSPPQDDSRPVRQRLRKQEITTAG